MMFVLGGALFLAGMTSGVGDMQFVRSGSHRNRLLFRSSPAVQGRLEAAHKEPPTPFLRDYAINLPGSHDFSPRFTLIHDGVRNRHRGCMSGSEWTCPLCSRASN